MWVTPVIKQVRLKGHRVPEYARFKVGIHITGEHHDWKLADALPRFMPNLQGGQDQMKQVIWTHALLFYARGLV